MSIPLRIAFLFVVALFLIPDAAVAYGGPGSVISGIGAFLAAVAAVLAAVFGFVWYPLKRLYNKMTAEEEPTGEAATSRRGE